MVSETADGFGNCWWFTNPPVVQKTAQRNALADFAPKLFAMRGFSYNGLAYSGLR
ncbi:Uncharacterised protein [Actinobaculum suis]|uniref:Uncharacterized protein n=1 Tax=Actinobaculum suis TaxID=1657 RepID=A0A7Z8Y9U3_9ACTO|nr:Uncharacterised protein [Actinobaculum suis]